jgi:glycosyltransferase involved in cell wall biosynthesis/SAM-dependent methyltransferase
MDKLQIAFYVPGMAFNGETPHNSSLGGSETAGWAVARELARRGHHVRMFCNLPNDRPGKWADVQYFPIQNAHQFFYNIPHDVAIVQRDPAFMQEPLQSKLNIFWCHDMALGRMANAVRSVTWNIDALAVVSEYMNEQYKRVYDLPPEFLSVLRNGIDLQDRPIQFTALPTDRWRRNPKRLVYAARPERGLDVLFDRILPPLLEAEPEIVVSLFGYDNPVTHFADFYAEQSHKAQQYGDRVRFEGYLSKKALYAQYCKGGIYCYPGPSKILPTFAEVSCISAIEAQMCGMPVVASNRGAMAETVHPEAGKLINGDPFSDAYQQDFVAAVLYYVRNPDKYLNASIAGRRHAETLTWEKRAQEWEREIERLFLKLNDDPVRLAHHYYRRSDIMPALDILETQVDYGIQGASTVSAIELKRKIIREYSFASTDEAFREHYIAGGRETSARLEKIPMAAHNFAHSDEPRYQMIDEFVGLRPDIKTILDYGCGHGWGTIYWSNRHGRCWTGYDIDPGAIGWCHRLAEAHAKHPQDLSFRIGDASAVAVHERDRSFDMVLCTEVLEHTRDPWTTLESLERKCKPGGWIYITVPYGPAEYGTDNWRRFRNHLWEFDYRDLTTVLAGKPKLTVNATLIYPNEQTNEMLGFYTVVYQADHKPLVRLDSAKRNKRQRPRETLSAIILAGPNSEDTLRWNLKSVQWVADEIIVGNCGGKMSPAAVTIAEEFGCKIIAAPDPTLHGFDESRNATLDAAVMDWVLWIDTDEKLVNGNLLPRYLRVSPWVGLAISQNHFSCDAQFPNDLPVRVFRRHPCHLSGEFNGKVMRFYGSCHEHPELELNKGPGPVVVVPNIHAAHVGYLNEAVRAVKFHRNHPLIALDAQKYPTRKIQKFFIMRDLMLLNMYESKQNGGRISAAMRDRARQCVALHREHFLGQEVYVNLDPEQYYSDALRQLGEGVDVCYNLLVNRDGVGDAFPPGSRVLRVASLDELNQELQRLARTKVESLFKEDW